MKSLLGAQKILLLPRFCPSLFLPPCLFFIPLCYPLLCTAFPEWSSWNSICTCLLSWSQISNDFPLPGVVTSPSAMQDPQLLAPPSFPSFISCCSGTHRGNLSPVPLRIASAASPSQRALSGSPSLEAALPTTWISSFSDFQFHWLSVSISLAPHHRDNYVFRWFLESISLSYQCHCLFLQERPRSFISLSPHWASSGSGNPGWALTHASRPGPKP